MVGIDTATIDALGQFPFPRRYHARLVGELRRAGVRQIAYDVQFTEPTTARDDTALLDAVADAGHVVLSTTEVDDQGGTNVFGGEATLRSVGARAANTLIETDPDGVLRRFPRAIDGLVSFPVASVEAATGQRVGGDGFDGHGQAYVDYAGGPGAIPTYSFVKVMRGRVPARDLRGKVVVVGATTPSLGDFHTVSTSGADDTMAGPEYQASAIHTLLRGIPLRPAPGVVGVLATLGLAGVAPLAGLRLGAVGSLLAAVAAGAVSVAGAYVAFRSGRVVPVVGPGLGLGLGTLGGVAVLALASALERERTRGLFGRFVAPSVVDEVLAAADGEVRLGGVRVDATVLFCDLRGSTALLESLGPEAGLEVLNRFLGAMTDAVLAQAGTLVGFRGDGLMAIFGAPLPQPDHAERALAAARDMVGPRLAAVNAGLSAPLRMGVGLDSGTIMAGNVGSQARMEYTAIGDPANVAARVESLTKAEGRPVLLTAATRDRLGPAAAEGLEQIGERGLRGRAAGVQLWAPAQPR